MIVIKTVSQMQQRAETLRKEGKVIGFVPTMGYLHEGHLSLIRIARKRADVVVVSIFVNPTQFGPGEDLDRYPRDFERDLLLAGDAGADIIFYPSADEMYARDYLTYVEVERITKRLCGISRPTHFRGVTTICTKLFNAVKPHFAVFGEKDFQQAVVIKKMVKDLNFDIEIITGPIIREKDGLAMSSRNTYLSPEERRDALSLYESLQIAEQKIREGERDPNVVKSAVIDHIKSKKTARIDYVSIVDPETLEDLDSIKDKALIALAVYIGNTRLIDNRVVEIRSSRING